MLSRKAYKAVFFGGLCSPLVILGGLAMRVGPSRSPLPVVEPVERRQTWCPTPEMRDAIIRKEVEAAQIPPRGASVTRIEGASSLSDVELGREVNRLVGEVNPGVALRSVSLSWDGKDAVLVLGWERSIR